MTVLAAAESVIGPARDAHIPVFTVIPGTAAKGALFDLGANYFEVGRLLGLLAGKDLKGESPAKLPVERVVPPKLFINTLALQGLRDPWKIPLDLLNSADTVIDEQGTREKHPQPTKKATAPKTAKPLAKTWRIHVLEYVNLPDVEDAEIGVLEAIRVSGLSKGSRRYTTPHFQCPGGHRDAQRARRCGRLRPGRHDHHPLDADAASGDAQGAVAARGLYVSGRPDRRRGRQIRR